MLLLLAHLALAAPVPGAFAGSWALDAAASSDPAPLLARLGVPSFLASATGSSVQTLVVSGSRLTVSVDSVLGDKTETVDLDSGAEYSGSFLSWTYRVRPRLDGEVVVSTGSLRVGEQDLPFETRRSAAGDRMTVEIRVGSGAELVVLQRVFRRVGA